MAIDETGLRCRGLKQLLFFVGAEVTDGRGKTAVVAGITEECKLVLKDEGVILGEFCPMSWRIINPPWEEKKKKASGG